MISTEKMIKIALPECVAMLGENLVNKHKDLCCGSYRITEEGLFSYILGMDTKKGSFSMGSETPIEFCAAVVVDPKTGNVTRDVKASKLPN